MSEYTNDMEIDFHERLERVWKRVREMLIAKNKAYGNSALDPVQVFSKGLPKSALIRVRMDDKISRIFRGEEAGEDVYRDLLGYLILYQVQQDMLSEDPEPSDLRARYLKHLKLKIDP